MKTRQRTEASKQFKALSQVWLKQYEVEAEWPTLGNITDKPFNALTAKPKPNAKRRAFPVCERGLGLWLRARRKQFAWSVGLAGAALCRRSLVRLPLLPACGFHVRRG